MNYKNGRARHRSSLVGFILIFQDTTWTLKDVCTQLHKDCSMFHQNSDLWDACIWGYIVFKAVLLPTHPQMWGDCGDGQCSNYDRLTIRLPPEASTTTYLFILPGLPIHDND